MRLAGHCMKTEGLSHSTGSHNSVHLARWRGHTLAQCGFAEAVDVLSSALDNLNKEFVRAETALRVDLVTALSALNEHCATTVNANHAHQLAEKIGSARQKRRLRLQLSEHGGTASGGL